MKIRCCEICEETFKENKDTPKKDYYFNWCYKCNLEYYLSLQDLANRKNNYVEKNTSN